MKVPKQLHKSPLKPTASPKGAAVLKLSGALAVPGPAAAGLLQLTIKGKDFNNDMVSAGLTNKRTAGKTGELVKVPLAVALSTADGRSYVYAGSVNVRYKAVQGKSGKASKAKVNWLRNRVAC